MAVADRGEREQANGGDVEHDPATGWHERLPIGAVVEVTEGHRLTERVVQGRAVVVLPRAGAVGRGLRLGSAGPTTFLAGL